MEYIALDFETANSYPDSACSLGMSLMDEEGRERDRFYSLIKPPVLYFDPACMRVHGLSADEIRKAPSFAELWSDISSFIGGRPVVAHNAAFDMKVLRESTLANGIYIPTYEYYCSYQISRKLLKGYPSHSLSYIVPEVLGLEYQAHLASDDAYACGRLFAFMCHGHLNEKDELEAFMQMNRLSYPKILKGEDGPSLF